MNKVEITLRPRDFQKRLKALTGFIKQNHQKAIDAAAMKGIELIENRTSKGFDVNGSRFKRYSATYADFRVDKGRNPYPVDLQFTGRMLGSMNVKRSGKYNRLIFFRGGENAKKAAKNQRTREFFGLNQRERSAVADTYFRRLTK